MRTIRATSKFFCGEASMAARLAGSAGRGGHQNLLIHVNDAGAQGQITIDPFVQEAKLTASDGAAGSGFGSSVSISGNTLVVGAPEATVGGNGGQGAAYVFTESGYSWANMTKTAKLTASDGAAGDSFGSSVSISGNTLVVGARQANIASNHEQGAAYVFVEPGSGWANMTQTAKLTASGEAGDTFGISFRSAATRLWSDRRVPRSAAIGTRAAYVFTEPGSGWASMPQMPPTAELIASDGVWGRNGFGGSVSISGNTVVVGSPSTTVGGNMQQGVAMCSAKSARPSGCTKKQTPNTGARRRTASTAAARE